MRKLALSLLAACLVAVALITSPVLAYNPFNSACNNGTDTGNSSVCSGQSNGANPITGANGIVLKAVNLVSIITGVASVFVIVFSGIQFVLSGGDSAKVTQARNTILYAVIGLIVIISARTIIAFVINRL